MPTFIEEQIEYNIEEIEALIEENRDLAMQLTKLRFEADEKNEEYLEKQKQIFTFLECRKSFFGKVKYFFKGKSGKKKIRRIPKELTEEIVEDVEDYEEKAENPSGNSLEDLIRVCRQLNEKRNENKNIQKDENNEYLLLDCNWKAGTEDTFPVLYEFDGENITKITKINGIDIMKNSVAVVSKPGGGTIIDSLATQTPMIYLDPISKHEKNNMDFYLTRNLGLSLNNALSANELVEQLKRIQDNILNYTLTKSLLVDYIL